MNNEIGEENSRHRELQFWARQASRGLLPRPPTTVVVFTSKNGKRIERETQPGSKHEERLLRRAAKRP